MNNICYFNNAATSWPKPNCVIDSVHNYFKNPPINSSRHCNCIKHDEDVDIVCKNKISTFFNVDKDIFDITITNGATYSANIVINYLSKKFNNEITLICDSSAHNSIYRTHFEKIGTKPIIFPSWKNIPNYLYDNGNCNYYVAISHVNNVDGTLLTDKELKEIFDLFRQYNTPIILDITQSAGTYDIDISKYNYDNLYVICSGHKGLYSTTGIGFLISPKKKIDIPLISGGTGGVQGIDYKNTNSLEAGTPNELAMVSLISGIDYIENKTLSYIRYHKKTLIEYFIGRYTSLNTKFHKYFELTLLNKNFESGILCFKIIDRNKCEEIIEKLTKDYHIILRTGVHCAPLYHINVLKVESTLRLSFGLFNTKQEIDYFMDCLINLK